MRTLADRLDRLCCPIPEVGCWLWTGATVPLGYGKISVRTGVTEYAHRVSWLVHRGEIPAGMYVCHRCDTPSCINPDHLFLGTPADNNRDMSRKGRNATGEACTYSKLNLDQARQIYVSDKTCKALADEFGISPSGVNLIKLGRIWKQAGRNQDQEQAA